jgi:hypothetical protein
MSGYVSFPTAYTAAAAQPWVDKSMAYVSQLPLKAKKKTNSK